MKTAIIIGHNERAPGAVRVTDGVPEYIWNTKLAKRIQLYADCEGRGDDVQIFFRKAGLGYNAEIRECYARVNAWKPDQTIELHFNSFTATSTGTEMLYAAGSTKGKILAQKVQDAVLNALGLSDRGSKAITRKDRGGASVFAANAPAIIVEPFFGSNKSDCATVDANFDKCAQGIWKAIK